MAASQPVIGDLFCKASTGGMAMLLLYSPLGLCLLIVRVFLGLHAFLASCLLPKTSPLRRMVLRTMCALLGIVVKEEGYRDDKARVLAANHVSPLDFTAFDILRPCALVNVWDLPALLRWCLGYVDLGALQGRATLIKRAQEFAAESEVPLLSFPEGALSSGKRALLKFSSWPFSLGLPVQPALLSISRPSLLPVPPVSTCLPCATKREDLLWFLFLPYSLFRLRWLPTQRLRPDEDTESFAKRVQALLAEEAGLAATGECLFLPYSLFRLRWLPTQRLRPDEDTESFAKRVQALLAEEAGLAATGECLFLPYSLFRLRWLPTQRLRPNEDTESFAKRVQALLAEEAGLAATGECLFLPYSLFRLRWLPTQRLRPDEDTESFAKRVQALLAEEAGLAATGECLFLPYSLFRLRWLPTQRLRPDEDTESFAKRVQALLAEEAGLAATGECLFLPYSLFRLRWLPTQRLRPDEDTESRLCSRRRRDSPPLSVEEFTCVDAVEYAKRWLRDEERARVEVRRQTRQKRRAPKSGMQLDAMALKVKETFPQIPLHSIRADLEATESVEATAGRILSGDIVVVEAEKGQGWRSQLEARKWAVIEENRKAYLARHGLANF